MNAYWFMCRYVVVMATSNIWFRWNAFEAAQNSRYPGLKHWLPEVIPNNLVCCSSSENVELEG